VKSVFVAARHGVDQIPDEVDWTERPKRVDGGAYAVRALTVAFLAKNRDAVIQNGA
jgi:hypothetical protein